MPERIPFIFSPGGFAIGRPLAVRLLIWDMMALVPQKVSQTPHERQRIRQQQAKPKLAELKAWMDQTLAATSTKSGLARAILYSARRWPALTRYADDGRIEIDNSAAERGLRCVALGRNNYLFADSDAGGEHAAAMYSLIGTAKLNGLDPQAYLRHALERIGDHPVNRIDDAASLERRRAAGTANRQAALGCLVLSAASMRCRAYAYCSSRQLLCTATTPTWRRSWAALLFGHVETDDEIIDRLELLRDSQGRSPGFEAFVPLVYPPGTTKLVAWLASPERGLQVLALSRLVLDNILHIKADWPTLQIETAAVALTFGADDLDGDSTPCAATAGSDRSAWKRLQLDEGTLRRPLIRNG